MTDPFDERMRELARAARAETEADLDTDHIDDALDDVRHTNATTAVAPGRPRHRRLVGWLTAAAALTFALSAGILFTRGTDDGVVTTDGSTPMSSPVSADLSMPAPTTLATTTALPTTAPSATSSPVVDPPTEADPTTTPVTTLPVATTMQTDGGDEVLGWREFPLEWSGIAGSCIPGAPTCTQLVHDADGDPVTYEPTTRILTRHVVPEVTATLPAGYGDRGFVVATGPQGVVYLSVAPAIPEELAADIVAVTLGDDDAGREIDRWSGVANTVGDSSLVPTPNGLVDVGCCGPDTVRPAVDADVVVPWVDRIGEPIVLETPVFVAEVEYPTLTVNRKNPDGSTQTWTYEPSADWMPRGMPNLTATFDGGFVAVEHGSQGMSITRGYADGRLDLFVLGPDFSNVDSVDPAGRILVGDIAGLDGRFARVDLFANGVNRWAGDMIVEPDGSIRFDDTSDVSAGSVVEFVAAIAPAAEVNEIRTIEIERRDETEWSATVTSSNLFDDSVAAVRWELVVERVDGRSFQVTSGRATQSCQSGRGHQDFSTELCV